MIEIIKELDVEVTKPNIFQAIVAKQYDMNTRFLKVTFKDCGSRIDIPAIETAKVVINAERKDGQSKGFDGVINEDGTVTVPLHSWMLELDGTVICDISVIDTAANDNKKLTTTSFTLLVEKAAYGGSDVTNDPQYDVLVSLLETCSEASTVAQEALDKSNEANARYDACVEATEDATAATFNANKAAENANAVRQEIEAGGFVESLKEMNSNGKFSVWVGTTEEYNALPEKVTNRLYILTDEQRIEESEENPGCYYRMVNGEQEWLNPPMLTGIEYRTTERHNGNIVYMKKIPVGTLPNSNKISIDTGVTISSAQFVRAETAIRRQGSESDNETYSYKMLPAISTDGTIEAVVFYGAKKIIINTFRDMSAYSGYTAIWYTKI